MNIGATNAISASNNLCSPLMIRTAWNVHPVVRRMSAGWFRPFPVPLRNPETESAVPFQQAVRRRGGSPEPPESLRP